MEVQITLIEQAKIFEGAFNIKIPRGLALLLHECRDNLDFDVIIQCTANISNIFCPGFLKKTDLGLAKKTKKLTKESMYTVNLKLEAKDQLKDEEFNIYYKADDSGKPEVLAQKNKQGEVALMVQVLPTFLPEPQEASQVQV